MALTISLNPASGKIGDTVVITADTGAFSVPYNKNVVTFNGTVGTIIAKILKGTSTELTVVIPPDAITGNVVVETKIVTLGENDTDSAFFEVFYTDEKFKKGEKPYDKAVINDKVKTVGVSGFNFPLYNKDLSYSNFIEVFDENSILQNVYTIILTNKGERLFSDFGSTVEELLFTPVYDEDVFKDELMNRIVTAVDTYEPRATILVNTSYIFLETDKVNVVLSIRMPSGSVRELGITLKAVKNFDS